MDGFLNLVRILLHPYQVHLVHSALAHLGTSYNHYRNGHGHYTTPPRPPLLTYMLSSYYLLSKALAAFTP